MNYITIIILAILILPALFGFLESFSRERLHYSMASLLDHVEFLFSLIASIYLTRRIFFEHSGSDIFNELYTSIPEGVKSFFYGKDVLTYLIVTPILMLVITTVLRLVTEPLYRYVVIPVADGVYSVIDTSGSFIKRFFGAVWQIPRSLFLVFTFGLLLNFYAYYFPTPALSKWMNESTAYQFLYKTAIFPALNSNLAKKVPVLVNDSFREIGKVLPRNGQQGIPEVSGQLKDELAKRNIKVIEYFNGVTLDEAIKSSPEIDETARKIVGNEKNSRKKAFLLYQWVSRHVEYDYDKADKLSKDPRGTSSGAIEAFQTRKGVCFDYSCLYIAMCRATGVKVRLVTGLGYSGVSWGDHAWNQVYYAEQNRWINVDTTFGSAADYFDKPDFSVDHRYDEVQGEW
ncbi:MAG: transglutaminase-like domain-containing protein [Clostridia bacterium]|nr:transglutaminase-like domain-containing protein [Clostridia bacterium]